MATRKFILGSAAGLVLAGAMLATAPAYAQYDNSRQYDYSRQSTPAERAATQDLNRNGVRTGPPRAADQSAYDTAQSRYNDAQAEYQRQLREYDERSRAYQGQVRGFDPPDDAYDGRNAYDPRDPRAANGRDADDRDSDDRDGDFDRAPPPDEQGRFSEDEPGEPDGFASLWELNRLPNPNEQLFNVQVKDIDGFSVGRFRRLETRDTGEVMAVITLDTMRTIAVPMFDVRYDPEQAVVVSDMTANQLISTPSDTPLGRAF